MALENPSEEKAYAAWLEGINAEAEERGLMNWPKTRDQFRASILDFYSYFEAGCTPAETFDQILTWAAQYDPKKSVAERPTNMPPPPTPPAQAKPKPYLH